MSRKAKTGLLASCIVALLGVAGVYVFLGRRGQAQAPDAPAPGVLQNVGLFHVGSALGEERAGFSGRAKVLIFASGDSQDWSAISSCLQSEAVTAQMGFFTGVLVDERAEPEEEQVFRDRDGLRVVVRGLNGAFLGGLVAGFRCQELTGLLAAIRAQSSGEPEKSPIYASLLESTAALDDLIERGKGADAVRYVSLLEEFEGSTSAAVRAAKARVGR